MKCAPYIASYYLCALYSQLYPRSSLEYENLVVMRRERESRVREATGNVVCRDRQYLGLRYCCNIHNFVKHPFNEAAEVEALEMFELLFFFSF